MITLTNNNFGGAAVTLKDYRSADICVLNGKITVDPTAAAYIAAERLELDLPADFVMKKSAMSSAVLMSNGVSDAYAKASAIGSPKDPTDTAIVLKSDYDAKYGAPTSATPNVFVKWFYVNAATGEKSGEMMGLATLV